MSVAQANELFKVQGLVVVELFDKRGSLKDIRRITNKITTAGDQFLIQKAISGVAPAAPAAPTAPAGMKLGSGGETAATKSGAGAALVTYISGSNNAFDATYPVGAAVGGDAGWKATFRTTWAAGDSTNSGIDEVALVNSVAADATSTAANTYARSVFGAINKAADDSLIVTWEWTILGA